MNHRIVSSVVAIIVALFVVASGLFAWAVTAAAPRTAHSGPPPENPHPQTRRTAVCSDCHHPADGTIPITHRYYGPASCAGCHPRALAVLVPHSVAMGDARCPLCHGDPERDHGIPSAHLRYETDECLLCHPVDARHYAKRPSPAGLSLSYAAPIPHQTDALFKDCTYCHQIGQRDSLPANHRDFALETCIDCHEPSDAAR